MLFDIELEDSTAIELLIVALISTSAKTNFNFIEALRDDAHVAVALLESVEVVPSVILCEKLPDVADPAFYQLPTGASHGGVFE